MTQHTIMSLPATAIMVLHHTLSLSATTIMMLHCTLSDRCYHYHGAPSYAVRHPLPLSGYSTVHHWYRRPLYHSAENHRIFPSFLPSDAVVETVRVQINTILFIFYEDIFEHSKLESLCDVIVTRIGDTLS